MAPDVQNNDGIDTSMMKYISSIFDALVNPINNDQFVILGKNDFYNALNTGSNKTF